MGLSIGAKSYIGIQGPAGHLPEAALLTLFFTVLAAALPIHFYLTGTSDKRCRGFILTNVFAAVYALSSSGLGNIFINAAIVWQYLALVSLYLLPAGVCDFTAAAFPNQTAQTKLGKLPFLYIYILLAAAALLGTAANLAPAGFFLLLFAAVSAVSMLAVLRILINALRSNSRAADPLIFGLFALLGSGTVPTLGRTVEMDLPTAYPMLWGLLIYSWSTLVSLRMLKTNAVQPLPQPGIVSPSPEQEEVRQRAISTFAHEVNTPIGTGLLAATHLQREIQQLEDLFRSGELKKSELEKSLHTYRTSADVLITNLNSAAELVRSFRQEAANSTQTERQIFHVDSHLRKLLQGLSPRITQAGHQLTYSCPEDLTIVSNPLYFSQMITNLIMNSLTHAYAPGEKGRLSLTITAEAGTLRLIYADDGTGLPRELLDKIFTPRFTTNAAGGNTGLGLSVVQSLVVQKLGGPINCSSEPGKGMTFTITLPVERR